MAGFSLRRRKFAPSGVALEASHEAAGAGLVAGFMFGPGSNSLIDLCGNQWIELFRHAHAVNPLTGKPALVCTNAVARMQLPNGLRLLSRTAGSVAISSRITGYTGGYPRRLQTQDDSMFRLARLAADNQVTVHLFGSNVDIPTTAPYYTTGQSVMGLSWDASHPTIKRGLYREGVLVGSSGTAPGSGTEDRYIQLDGGAGEVDWMFFFDRAVDQQALFDDPMALVRARRQVLYFDTGGGAAALVIPGDTHGHAADALVLSADLALAVGGDAHGHSADAPALSAELALSIAASAHAHMADGPALSSAQVLAVADALHAHAAAALALTGDSALVVGGDAHAHTVDGVTLSATGADDLIIAGDMHGHAADAVAFTSASMLAVAGALHAHHAETAELGAALALSISGGLHAHSAESLTLTDVPTLGVAGALHAHTADSLALSTDVVLAIADAVHAHLADDVDMTYAATLAILESMHAHAADSLALTSGGGSALGLPDEIRVAIRERFIIAIAAERRILRS